MKITIALIFLLGIQVSANTYGQKVHLNVKNEQLNRVLAEIKKQTGYSFLINSNYLKNSKPVTLSANDENLIGVLDDIFSNQPFNYIISDKIITINPETIKPKEVIQQKISGTVTDNTGKPLAGVTVTEIGSSNATNTNNEGKFTLSVSKQNAALRFNFIGYVAVQRPASDNMNITLSTEDRDIDEVVVTGFQKINKQKFTGSVSSVDKKLIERSGYVDVSKMLQGAAAGVSVQNVSGTMGTSAKIRIRGNASISANQEPLYVVNGVAITSPANVAVSQLYSGDVAAVLGSAIAGLNAQDIEDIQILKDGAATSLYGTRAANGVISITTKSGKSNESSINYSSSLAYGLKPNVNDFNLMTSEEEMNLNRRLWNAGYYSNEVWPSRTGAYTEAYRLYGLREIDEEKAYADLRYATRANTDWFDVLFKNNLTQEHNLSFSGGTDKNTYYVSGNYSKDNGQAIGYDFDRYTVDFRDVIKPAKWLSLDINANYSQRNQKTPGVLNSGTSFGAVNRSFELNPLLYAAGTSRAMVPYNEDGTLKYYMNNLAPFNIIEELGENFADINAQEFRVMVRPTFKINENWTYEFTGALRRTYNIYNHTATERSNYAEAHRVDYNEQLREKNDLLWRNPNDPNAVKESILPFGGIMIARSNSSKTYNIRNQVTFDKSWTDHHLNSLVGSEIREEYIDRSYNKNFGYMYYSGKTTNPSSLAYLKSVSEDDKLFITSFQNVREVGFYTSHQYSYLNRYNVEGGLRFDASNVFGKAVRSKFLPNYSLGFSWNMEKEAFFQNSGLANTIDFVKLRASYALRGNTFQTSPQLNAQPVNLNRIDEANSLSGIRILSPELYSLNWERDLVKNIGIDIGLFNKINATVEYYHRKNSDLISSFNTSLEEGFANKLVNWANMTNNGIDVTIAANNVLNGSDFKWDLSFIYGYVKNKIIDGTLQTINLTTITRPNGYGLEGNPLEGLYAYNFSHLNTMGRPMFSNGVDIVNGLASSSTDRNLISYMGPRSPTSTGSAASTFNYKDFSLRVFFTFAAGHKVFNNAVVERAYFDVNSKSNDLNYMWQTSGNEVYTYIPGLISTTQQSFLSTLSNIDEVAFNRSTARVVDASHVRLSELMVTYNATALLKRDNYIKNARITLSANNLKYWASERLRGVDPDVYITGVNLPNPRTFSLRLALGF
ncbi:SusC/RagA family TonB-linked outer membrane protein [Sphingobacterium bovistauri]|uniref:SusC/RagA family TonB-linked outer membrane protein n=1 Tax=Sphingobacterium bovistauri TaxID=2781959 RepID=A0ABS7Z286_9SPHI|nr:SusC/RagA family TonB-linked outer membrane protein [Sphingobacterium bovistauri]MCA5004298.1 SusC/RagA family TonB-linked outer membrane protein [Sphingobacterium bovistauri]